MKSKLYNLAENKEEDVVINDAIFSLDWNNDLVYQSLVAHRANTRQKIAHTKGTSDVSGGGRKPWRQKGTGRARHGTIRSPLWKGGGVTFGPRIEKEYEKKINKKMKKKAFFTVLSKKLEEGEIYFVESLRLENGKTKEAENIINNLSKNIKDIKEKNVLFIPSLENKNFAVAVRNIEKTKAIRPESLNIYDLLSCKYIIFDKQSVEELEKHFLNK
jgi:large subunit ribosomal protein L4